MIRFLRWLFGVKPPVGYRCDGCEAWTPRRKGKALVECRNPGVYLYCPGCAELKRYAREQTEKAKTKTVAEREKANIYSAGKIGIGM